MKAEQWKKEFEQYKIDLTYLKTALDYVEKAQDDPLMKRVVLGGVMQAFGAVIHRGGRVMNEYMQSLGQSRNKSLKNILVKALKMGVIVHQRWIEAEMDLDAFYEIEGEVDALKMEKKIRRIYLPLLERFKVEMALKSLPTLFG